MLTDLRIRNLAVVEDLEIAFEPGLNVITGETGAGKTILMRALGLLLGDRGGPDLLRAGASEGEVEALFNGPAVAAALADDNDRDAAASGGGLDGDAAAQGAGSDRDGVSARSASSSCTSTASTSTTRCSVRRRSARSSTTPATSARSPRR